MIPILVRLVTRDDPNQVPLLSPYLVLAEARWVLRSVYGLASPEIATAVEMLLNHKDLTLQDSGAVTAALAHYKRKPSLSFSDCLVLEIARKAGHLRRGTFDRDLGKLDGSQRL